jgi:hypothetical protein
MARASDTDLLNLFDELHDGTGWQHPRHFMKGGRIEASRAFGKFAETNQQRALKLLRQLQPGRHETYAAAAMQAMCEAKEHDVAALIESAQEIATRGFNSEEFRHSTAWGLAKLGPEAGGLDPGTCGLLESWLTDDIESSLAEETPAREAKPSNILLGQKMRMLPRGNYPILHALFVGHLTRSPADVEGWLAVLERHILRRENPQVWETLTYPDLTMLARAERHHAIDFVERLVEHHPAVANTIGFVHFIGRAHDWLPESVTHHCLAEWGTGSWKSGPQAAAEIAMLRYSLTPSDETCKVLVERILKGDGIDPDKAKVMRTGVAFLAAELWSVQRARGICTRVLLDLLPLADESLANAWLSVFRHTELLVDQHTHQLLDALAASPHVLRCGHSGFLVDRLKDLLQESTEAQRVCRIATALLEECGPEVGDFRTAWSASAGDLVDIALTLQRLEATRTCGLDLFERLMDFNAYKVAESLTELDRRFPN